MSRFSVVAKVRRLTEGVQPDVEYDFVNKVLHRAQRTHEAWKQASEILGPSVGTFDRSHDKITLSHSQGP